MGKETDQRPLALMLASGHGPLKRKIFKEDSRPPRWTTLDVDGGSKPDILYNLNHLRHGGEIPVRAASFDEIHVYNAIHMWGVQGSAVGFFNEFNEYWRILKDGGLFFATMPAIGGGWDWADPGCKRMLHPVNFRYLTESFYDRLGTEDGLTDYRDHVKGWWRIVHEDKVGGVYIIGLEKTGGR